MSSNKNKKILNFFCCDHFLNFLHENLDENSYFEVNDKIYECQHAVEEHKFVTVKCPNCKCNFSYGFEKNYYASTSTVVVNRNLEQKLVLFLNVSNVDLPIRF